MYSCDPLIYFKPGLLLLSLKHYFPNVLQPVLQSALTESTWKLQLEEKVKERLISAALHSGPGNVSGGGTVFPTEMGVNA